MEEGISRNEIKHDDPLSIAVILWGSLTGTIMLHEGEDHRKFMPVPLDILIEKSINILIEGLKNNEPEDKTTM